MREFIDKISIATLGILSIVVIILACNFVVELYQRKNPAPMADKQLWPLQMIRLPVGGGFTRYANDEVICYELRDRISCIRNYLGEKHGKR